MMDRLGRALAFIGFVAVAAVVGLVLSDRSVPAAVAQVGDCDARHAASEAARRELEAGLAKIEAEAAHLPTASRDKIKQLATDARAAAAQKLSGSPSATIGPAQHAALRQSLLDADGWDERLALVRAAATQHRFTTAQVISLMNACEYDSTRVDLARILHPSIVDPDRWPEVYLALEFEGNRRQLRRYVEDR